MKSEALQQPRVSLIQVSSANPTDSGALGRLPWKRTTRSGMRWPAFDYRFSGEGLFFILLMVLIGFAAWHSGTNLLYLMFSMLIGFFLVQGLLVWMNLKGLSAQRELPRSIHAATPFRFTVSLKNRKPALGSYSLMLTDLLPDRAEYAAGFAPRVPPGGTTAVDCMGMFPDRGRYLLQSLRITTRHPFGFIERSTRIRQPEEVLVYPFIANTHSLLTSLGNASGEQEARRRGPGNDFHGLREYQSGDHARRIHWRSTARARKLMLMEFEREERRQAVVVLDDSVSPDEAAAPGTSELFELSVCIAASVAMKLMAQGFEVGFLSGGGWIPPGTGNDQAGRVLRVLAMATLRVVDTHAPAHPGEAASVIHIHRGNSPWLSRPGVVEIDAREWDLVDGSFQKRRNP